MTERPQDASWIALLDQASAAAKDLAPLLHSYFESLTDSGFTRGEAMLLTADFQRQLMTPPKDED